MRRVIALVFALVVFSVPLPSQAPETSQAAEFPPQDASLVVPVTKGIATTHGGPEPAEW